MTQSLQSRSQASGPSRTVRGAAPRATAALRRRERAEALPSAAEVHVWFAAPSPSSRYLDIVLASRSTRTAGA